MATSAQVPVVMNPNPQTVGDQAHGKVVHSWSETERLNDECLELEEQVGSLKTEGQEA